MARLFISHSSKDKAFVVRLASDLQQLGHEPWLDEWEIKVGECIQTKIEHGIAEADFLVIVLSNNSTDSNWVEREWKAKYWEEVGNNVISVLPVLKETCTIPLLLCTKKYADFRKTYSIGLVSLSDSLVREGDDLKKAASEMGRPSASMRTVLELTKKWLQDNLWVANYNLRLKISDSGRLDPEVVLP